jgi:hypothetical protein
LVVEFVGLPEERQAGTKNPMLKLSTGFGLKHPLI